jgi:hypothetical protein
MPTCSGLLLAPLLTDIIATSITHIRTRLPTYPPTALFYRVVCSIITLLGSSLRCDSDASKPRVKLGAWAGFKHLFRCRNQSRWGWGERKSLRFLSQTECKINFVDKPSSHGSLKETELIFLLLFIFCLGQVHQCTKMGLRIRPIPQRRLGIRKAKPNLPV